MLGHEASTGKIMTPKKFPVFSVPMCLNNEGVPSSIKKKKKNLEEAGSINAAYSTSCYIKKQATLNRIRKPVNVLFFFFFSILDPNQKRNKKDF